MKTRSVSRLVLVAAVMLAVPVVVFLPYLWQPDVLMGPRSGLGTDISYRHWPDLTYYARALEQEHEVALWDSSVAGGRPLAGDPGVLWLYPLDLFFLFLPPALAFNVLGLLHVVIGGLGAFAFLRKGLRLSFLAALLGGSAYLLSPKLIAHVAGGHVGLAYGAAWIPWALLGTHWAAQGRWQGTLLAGASLALQMPTHIQIPFYTAWLMATYALWKILTGGAPARSPRRLLVVAAILPWFIITSAALLFPLLGLLPFSSRQGLTLENASWYSIPPFLLTTFIFPTNFQFPEWVLYPGAVTLLLAVLALLNLRRRETLFWAGVVLFSLVYAVGPATPLFPLLHRLPGFAQLRVPPRIWFIGAFAMSVLAALGMEATLEARTQQLILRRERWFRLAVLGLLGAEAVLALGMWLTGSSPGRLLLTLFITLATIVLFALYLRHRLSALAWQRLAIFLLVLELAPVARLYTEPIAESDLLGESAAFRYLQEQAGLWRVYSCQTGFPYARAAEEDIETAEGLLALQMDHYVQLVKHASGCLVEGYGTGVPPCLTTEVDPEAYLRAEPRPDLLGLLNVRFVLCSVDLDNPDLELVASFDGQHLYENRRWLPRAFVVFEVRSLPAEDAVLDGLDSLDPSRTALLAEPLSLPAGESRTPVPAEVVSQTANEFSVRVEIPRAGLLIVSRTWMPGWRAWVDGVPAPVHRVDYALQGVSLSPGAHEVVLRYQPTGWQFGWPLSLVGALVTVVGLAGWTGRRLFGARE